MNLAKCGKCGKKWDDETQSLVCPHPPKVLGTITDKVLAYRPKPKSQAAKRRVRKSKKIQKDRESSI